MFNLLPLLPPGRGHIAIPFYEKTHDWIHKAPGKPASGLLVDKMWVDRDHITRGAGGYDLAEIVAYLPPSFTRSGEPETNSQRRQLRSRYCAHAQRL